jgi:hypothetical protein
VAKFNSKLRIAVYSVDDTVLVCERPTAFSSNPTKLFPRWRFKGTISEALRGHRYRVKYGSDGGPDGERAGEVSKVLSSKRLKKFASPTMDLVVPEEPEAEEEAEPDVPPEEDVPGANKDPTLTAHGTPIDPVRAAITRMRRVPR